MRYHFTPIKLATTQKSENDQKIRKIPLAGMENDWTLAHCPVLWETVWRCITTSEIQLLYDPPTPVGMCTQESEAGSWRDKLCNFLSGARHMNADAFLHSPILPSVPWAPLSPYSTWLRSRAGPVLSGEPWAVFVEEPKLPLSTHLSRSWAGLFLPATGMGNDACGPSIIPPWLVTDLREWISDPGQPNNSWNR